MFKIESYSVHVGGKKVGYLQRQGEDGRFIDKDGERLKSFFPWGEAIKWAKLKEYKLKKLQERGIHNERS